MNKRKPLSAFANGLSWPIFHGVASLWLLLLACLQASSIGHYIDTHITAPLLFNSREFLEQTPAIDPKLKIFALDDNAFSYLGGPRLSLPQLTELLTHINQRKPKAIMIDSLLSDEVKAEYDADATNKLNLPVFSGNFPSPTPFRFRTPTDLQMQPYQASHYLIPDLKLDDLNYRLDKRRGWIPYGHAPSYKNLIRATGHITYGRDGTISPFYQINATTILPHLSLYAADSVSLQKKGLYINQLKAPLTRQGSLVINYRPAAQLYTHTYSIKSLLERARTKSEETLINPGDIVLILLAFATGNTDFHEGSPFGEIPGGLMIATMISDQLQGTWINRWEYEIPTILLFGIAGIILGINARVRYYWLYLGGIWLISSGCVVSIFAFKSHWLPWIMPLMALTGTSLIHFAHARIQDEITLIKTEKKFYTEKNLRLENMQKNSESAHNIAQGRALQKLLLPKLFDGSLHDFHFKLQHKPCSSQSGDWLYVWDFAVGERRLFIGDVMSTNPAAAIPIAAIMSSLKDAEEQRLSIEEALARLNRRLYQLFDRYVACKISVVVIHREGPIELYNSGGPGYLIFGANQADHLVLRSTAIGLNPKIDLAHCELNLSEQQTLIAFTDGYLGEATDLKPLLRHLRQEKTVQPALETIEGWLLNYLPQPEQADDQTLLWVERRPIPNRRKKS